MQPLLLNTYDAGGGASRATIRLGLGLRAIGTDAQVLVQHNSIRASNVIGPSNSLEKIKSLFRRRLDKIMLSEKCDRYFSTAWVPGGWRGGNYPSIDIVHLHWILDGFLSIESLKRINKPIVWTFHDMWAMTGGCHVDSGCGKYRAKCGTCPALFSHREKDLSRRIFSRKIRAWQKLNFTIICPSRWLASCASQSSLFSKQRIEIIPNGIDTKVYKPINKNEARYLLNIPKNKKIIAFSAINATVDKNKGFHLLEKTLLHLKEKMGSDNIELVVLGASTPENPPDFGFPTKYLGRFKDDISLVALYSAADIILVPSLQENLPYAIMEALSCGTPCVAFDVGGNSDLIEHQGNGYLATPYEPEDMAEGISWIFKDDQRREWLSTNAREKVKLTFDLPIIARKHLALYEEVLALSQHQV